MSKKSRNYRSKLLYVYISIILSVFSFFTMYAYRFNVMDILHNKGYINFEISTDTVDAIQNKLFQKEITNQNMDEIADVMREELPDHTYEISYIKHNVQDEEEAKDFFYMYGRGPYKESSKYARVIEVEMQNMTMIVTCFPYFSQFFLYYSIIAFLITLLLAYLYFTILNKGWIERLVEKLYRKAIKNSKFMFTRRLSIKMVIINSIAILTAFLIFTFAYSNRYAFFEFMLDTFYQKENFDQYVKRIREDTKDLKMNKANKDSVMQILNMIENTHYEAYLYKENGLFYVGGDIGRIAKKFYYGSSNVYSVSAINSPLIHTYSLDFSDQTGMIVIYSYPLISYGNLYQYVIIAIAFSFYLIILLYFIQIKIQTIRKMQEDISVLANGDWKHVIEVIGNDEIAELGEHLNQMQISFIENMNNEKAARNANKDLISAMSHDLRTPLTTLNGYLEIVQLQKGDEEKRKEYIQRCLDKVEEIRDLSDKMFEYSLVFLTEDNATLQQVHIRDISECLNNHIHYLKVLEFSIQNEITAPDLVIDVNWGMLKRVFNNLFSNVQKYADKNKVVRVLLNVEKNKMKLVMANYKNESVSHVESNGIGLKSVKKIVAVHKGECYINDNDKDFMIIISLPINKGDS